MPSLLDLLGETWPARMAKSAWSAAKLPGDVYAGRTDPLSDEGIGRAADLGGMVMGGTFAGAPAGAMGAGIVKPIRAYHGSPHDFDRFDLSKIGTGEGAQAYGHGLYFAENPTVAQQYRDTLAPSRGKLPDDIISLPPEMRQAVQMHASGDKSPMDAAKRVQWMSPPFREVEQAKIADMIERYRTAKQGRMYEVNINADPAQFLDWDKALAQQAPDVRDVLHRVGRNPDTAINRVADEMKGMEFYNALASRATPRMDPLNVAGIDKPLATTALREAGIPGIKYLDQGSRFNQALFNDNPIANEARKFIEAAGGNSEKAAEAFYRSNPVERWAVPERDEIRRLIQQSGNQPTSNYVLFRDDIIDIVKKYGLAGAAAMYGISQDEAKAAMDNPKDKKMSIGRQTYGDEE